MMQDINKTIENGLCTSCGICAAVCPFSCIQYERKQESYLPTIDTHKCVHCGKCLQVCPGYSQIYSSNKNIFDPICFTVQAKNKEILKNASSGGVITAMVKELLEREQYQTAFLVMEYQYDNQAKTTAIRKGDSLCSSQQSRYLPVSQEKAIKYIIHHPEEKIIFIGTGCAVHGLCKVLTSLNRSRKNVLILGLFCDQTMTYSIYEYIKHMKKWDSPVSAVHFRDKRAGGWPGNLRIEFQNGTYKHFSAKERILVKDFCRQKRCLYCLDKLNVEADISLGDNYTGKHISKEGNSSLIIRTQTGLNAFNLCQTIFEFFPSSYQDIYHSQHMAQRLSKHKMNNLIYAKQHSGRMIEQGEAYDFSFTPENQPLITPIDKHRLKKQLSELSIGENSQYTLMRRKRITKLLKMYINGLLIRLNPKRQ